MGDREAARTASGTWRWSERQSFPTARPQKPEGRREMVEVTIGF